MFITTAAPLQYVAEAELNRAVPYRPTNLILLLDSVLVVSFFLETK